MTAPDLATLRAQAAAHALAQEDDWTQPLAVVQAARAVRRTGTAAVAQEVA